LVFADILLVIYVRSERNMILLEVPYYLDHQNLDHQELDYQNLVRRYAL
jgi:hypothetical protein